MLKLLRAIPLSFYSRALYRDVGRSWKGYGLLYILLVLTLFMVPVTIERSEQLDNFLYGDDERNPESLRKILEETFAQLPDIAISGNEVVIKDETILQPYIVAHPRTQVPVAIIDATGKTQSLRGQEAPILIKKQSVIFRLAPEREEEISIAELTSNLNMPLKRDFTTIAAALAAGPYLLGAADLLFGGLAFGLRAALFAGFAFLICSQLRRNVAFTPLLRLAAVSSTPVIACEMLSAFLGHPLFASRELVYFLLHAAYLYHAVESNVMAER